MATLTGSTIASSYLTLLKLTSAALGADASAKYIEDAAGTDSALSISTTRVGIGTSSPSTNLHLSSASAGLPVLLIENTRNDANGGELQLYNNRGAGNASDDDQAGQITFYALDDADNKELYGWIRGEAADVSATEEDGAISFTNKVAGSYVEAVRIVGDNVGIGTDAPRSVQGYSGSILEIGSADDVALVLTSDDGEGGENMWEIGNNTSGKLEFSHSVAGDGSTGTKMVIDSSGNIGVGDTDPSEAKLSIDNVLSGDVGINLKQDQAQYGISIDHNANSIPLYIDHDGVSNYSTIYVDTPATTTGAVIYVDNASSLTAGLAAKFTTSSTALATTVNSGLVHIRHFGDSGANVNNLLLIENDDAGSSGTTGLHIQQDAAGRGIKIDQNGDMHAIDIDSESAAQHVINVEADALTTGSAGFFYSNSSDPGTRGIVKALQANASATGATALIINQASTAPSIDAGAGYMVNEQGRNDHIANTMSAPYYRFDGTDDYIDITTASNSAAVARDLEMGFVEALFRTGQTPSGRHIVCFGDTGGNTRNHMICTNGSSQLYVDLEIGNVRKYSAAGSTTLQAHTTYHVLFVHNATTPKLYLNGVEETLTFSITADKTVWNNGNATWDRGSICSHQSAGDARGYYSLEAVYRVRIGSYVPTDTEIKELYSGASVPFKYKGASQTLLNTGTATNQSPSFSGFSSASATGYTASNDTAETAIASIQLTGTIEKGKSYLVSADHTTFSGVSSVTAQVRESANGGGATYSGTAGNFTSGVNHFVISSDATSIANPYLIFRYTCTDSASVVVRNISMIQIGAVAEWDGTGIASDKWMDKSGNGAYGTPTGGVSVENAPSDDDGLVYEEGTFTLATTGHSGTLTVDTSYDTLLYRRIGNVVHCQGNIKFSAASGHSGNLGFTGLPYVSVTGTDETSMYPAVNAYIESMASAIDGYVTGLVDTNTDDVILREGGLTGDGSDLVNHIDTGTQMKFQITYFI